MATVIEVVSLIGAPPRRVFELELNVDVHAASLPGSRETATTNTGRHGTEVSRSPG